jgi:hypothetical protein
MFKTDNITSGSTLTAILKENTAVVNKGLTRGLSALFLGHLGSNLGKTDTTTETFKGSHIILCQLNCEANKTANHKRTSQWALFSPHMNTVMTCHDTSDKGINKHAWVLGNELIEFFKSDNQARIDRRFGKIVFPHKSDNATDVRLNHSVFITAKSKNLGF